MTNQYPQYPQQPDFEAPSTPPNSTPLNQAPSNPAQGHGTSAYPGYSPAFQTQATQTTAPHTTAPHTTAPRQRRGLTSLLAVAVYSYVLYRTPFGVHLRAVGEDEGAAEAAGIAVMRTKFISILISGVLCGLAGAQLAMATLGSFTANMTAGRGFIAVAALTFGLGKPVRTMVASFIFGAADAVADQLGVAGVNSNLALMTPYIITIVALVLAGVRIRNVVRHRAEESATVPTAA